MQGKTVVITGATSGIGQIAAERLAAMGARIVQVARDRMRGEAALARLKSVAPNLRHTIHYADLSVIAEMKRVAGEIASAEPRIDVLINNAGAVFGSRRVTTDGLEMTFATNHMAYWVMTHGLRERLVASKPARIVSTASDAHKGQVLNFDDLQAEKGYSAFSVYGRSKLANILFTRALAKRTADIGVTANCLHPGFVSTRFGDAAGGLLQPVIGLAKFFAISPEKGAETIVYLASSPDVATASGGYYYKKKLATPTQAAQDDAAAERLWDVTKRLAGVTA